MMPATLSIISNAFPPAERGKAIGTWAGVSAIALALGPLVGGWLTEDVTWRAIFFINVPVAAIAVVVTLFAAHESRDETATKQVDFPGIATLTIGLTALVLALVEGNSWGWTSPGIIALLLTAVIGLVGFVQIERTSRRADRRLQLLQQPQLPRREPGRVRDQLRHVRRLLLPRALHAEHPRLLAAADRRALPPEHDPRDDRRPAGGAPRRTASARASRS